MDLSEINSNNYRAILKSRWQHITGESQLSATPIVSRPTEKDNKEIADSDGMVVKHLQQPYRRKFTPEETESIISAYKSGKSSYEIGAEFNCSKTTILKLLKQQGINVTRSKAQAKVNADEVIRMYEQMVTTAEIAKYFGVNPQIITKCLRERGIKARSRWDYPRE